MKLPRSQQVAAASPSHHKLPVSLKEMCGDAAKAVGAGLEAIFPFKPNKAKMKEREIGGRFFTVESWQALAYKEDVA